MTFLPKNKVVIPVDFSPQSLAAAEVALDLVQNPSHLHIIHVLPIITDYEVGLAWANIGDDARRRHAEQALKERLPEPKFASATKVVLFGDAGTEIARYAEEQHADAIVIPSHGYTGLKRLLIGSVAERVVRLAHCPVLVLKHVKPTL